MTKEFSETALNGVGNTKINKLKEPNLNQFDFQNTHEYELKNKVYRVKLKYLFFLISSLLIFFIIMLVFDLIILQKTNTKTSPEITVNSSQVIENRENKLYKSEINFKNVTLSLPKSNIQPLNVKIQSGPYEKVTVDGHLMKSVMPTFLISATNTTSEKVYSYPEKFEISVDLTKINFFNIDKETLSFFIYNTTHEKWEKIPTELDFNSNTAKLRTNSFANYSLKGKLVDLEAPTTTVSLIGEKIGTNKYKAPVKVVFESVDIDGVGVLDTIYTIGADEWDIYNAPIIIEKKGVYKISYMSYDNAGNEEKIKSIGFLVH